MYNNQNIDSIANALYKIFSEHKDKKNFYNDIVELRSVFQQVPEFISFCGSYFVDFENKKEIINNVFKNRIDEYLINFLFILIEKKYIYFVELILNRLIKKINFDLNIIEITIQTVFEISEKQLEEIKQILEKKYNKTSKIKIVHNPDLIGGIKIISENDIIEGSIKGKINEIKKHSLFLKGD